MIVVSDTSAISALLQVKHESLQEELYGDVVIPEAVRNELLRTHPVLPAFLRSLKVHNLSEVQRLNTEVDLGEAEAITLAKECRADLLLIDDLAGRSVALREGVPIIGLLGVLVLAKQAGHIPSVRKLVAELQAVADFRISEEIKTLAFRKAGEP